MNEGEPDYPGREKLLALLRVIDSETGPDTEEIPCSYLAGRMHAQQSLTLPKIPGEHAGEFTAHGYRRFGHRFYRMRCPDCSACVPIRIPVAGFTPTKSQRRVRRKNRDVTVDVALVTRPVSDEAFAVYERYLEYQHSHTEEPQDREFMERFLYEDATDSIEISYRVDGRLMGVSIVDICDRSWSSVYHFFEPDFACRSPGVYSVLAEIEVCRRRCVPYYYLGYWIAGCPAMAYKANYRPCEVLVGGVWQELASDASKGAV